MPPPDAGWALIIAAVFVALCSGLAIWSRQQPLVDVGQVMNRTVLVRVKLRVADRGGDQPGARRPGSGRCGYNVRGTAIAQLRASLENLPRTLASVESADQLAEATSRQFRITPESLADIKTYVNEETVSPQSAGSDQRLIRSLSRRPLLDDQTYQRETQEGLNTEVELRRGRGRRLLRLSPRGS